MSVTVSSQQQGQGGGVAVDTRPRRRIEDWRPEDEAFWAGGGAVVARRNMAVSIFTEHVGFSVWSLWSAFVLFMGPAYHVDTAGKFLLTTLPTVVGSVLRLPYTFAVATFGGRTWTVISASLLLIPTITAAFVLTPGTSYTVLLIAAALTGVGGGNFASSMANINSFYPQRLKGRALGMNAGGGNLGVATVQLIALAVLAGAGKDHPRLILAVYIPLIVIGAATAALLMNNLAHVAHDRRAMRDAMRDRHGWVIALLYIGTFGSFIGFGFAFGQVLQVQFAHQFSTPIKAAYLTFLGPLLGSLIRPVGGTLADRFGGARVTFCNFVAMAVAAAVVLTASLTKSLPLFLVGFIALFVFSGVGNGSTYKMIPSIFRAKATRRVDAGADADAAAHDARRLSSGLIGIAGAIGAFGGALVNLAFRESFLTWKSGNPAYVAFLVFYAICFAATWMVFLRRSPNRLPGV